MTNTPGQSTRKTATARQKPTWDKSAPGHDERIAVLERTWFGGAR
jgi:hypothetical protein